MLHRPVTRSKIGLCALALGTVLAGCAGGGGLEVFSLLGSPFRTLSDAAGGGTVGDIPGSSSGSGGLGGSVGPIDPCDETQSRKFIRLSLRNLCDDNIHYFLVLIALIQSERYPEGAVCPDDVNLYTSFGYEEIPDGSQRSFGNHCIDGPALIYFHETGEFRAADGSLASGIEPSRGSGATFDRFFNSAGALVPVPNRILFHNPGSGAGFRLKIAPTPTDACNTVIGGVSNCGQDAFYYVDDNDNPIGSTAVGVGSAVRVPNEIQGTGCQCGASADPWAELAASNVTASNAACNEFLRGGTVAFAFIRDDTTPPFPQLVWRVTAFGSGGVAHDFDPRANVPP